MYGKTDHSECQASGDVVKVQYGPKVHIRTLLLDLSKNMTLTLGQKNLKGASLACSTSLGYRLCGWLAGEFEMINADCASCQQED